MRSGIVAAMLAGAVLSGCVADQSPRVPTDPAAPFPLSQSRIVAQPSPGAIVVETRQAFLAQTAVQRAAQAWCGGPAQTSLVSNEQDLMTFRVQSWLVRCR